MSYQKIDLNLPYGEKNGLWSLFIFIRLMVFLIL